MNPPTTFEIGPLFILLAYSSAVMGTILLAVRQFSDNLTAAITSFTKINRVFRFRHVFYMTFAIFFVIYIIAIIFINMVLNNSIDGPSFNILGLILFISTIPLIGIFLVIYTYAQECSETQFYP